MAYDDVETMEPPGWAALLGYLNYSEGRPDCRFQRQLADAFRWLAAQGASDPCRALLEVLGQRLAELKASGAAAFRNTEQVEAVLPLGLRDLPRAYRRHHADVLAHWSDAELFQPFLVARFFEAILAQGGPWHESERIIRGSLLRLNDYVGHRPIAILETRPQGEPYPRERVRPIPLYLRGAGVAPGRYHDLVSVALDILARTDPSLRLEASFDLELLDELALDPRAYDHGHPVNRRPNYVFGEWDPHQIDEQGRYRRFVVRPVVLDALMQRVGESPRPEEALLEAATVLAGTMLMAAGISGSGPAAHDSSASLATLLPRIARCRDAFYAQQLQQVGGEHGSRLRAEAAALRQPFGGARQHLNEQLARQRAIQLQQRHLALVFAALGYPQASQEEAERVAVPSIRMMSAMLGRLAAAHLLAEQGDLEAAARLVPEVEELLQRGIECGALADPWNILGFQGLFPLSAAREDSVRDPRIDELIVVIEQIFHLYSRLLSEAAATGRASLADNLLPAAERLARWWDRFATTTVSDVRHIDGAEAVASARHVARALARWHERGEASGDLAFWRQHLEGFRSPKAFALVIEALLRKKDFRASMALLMNWLSQHEHVPLEDNDFSFHTLALRWMLLVTIEPRIDFDLIQRFFDHLEANADDLWNAPALTAEVTAAPAEDEKEEELYGAAYENVTYRDSADDEHEGSVAEEPRLGADFPLEDRAEPLLARLRFLSTLARLWPIAARTREYGQPPRLADWLAEARAKERQLLAFLEALHACPVPSPVGGYESMIEFDRRRVLKERLVYAAIGTCLDAFMAVGALHAAQGSEPGPAEPDRPAWEPSIIRLEHALYRGDLEAARALLPELVARFRDEPLVFPPLDAGGTPRTILRARIAQTVLRALCASLPRVGLLRETYQLVRLARVMEEARPVPGQGLTEFNQVFQTGFQAVIEAVVGSSAHWTAEHAADRPLANVLEAITSPFLRLWVDHSRTVTLSALDSLRQEQDWVLLRDFIRRYGRDLFHARFMTLANLRGILHRGVGDYLRYLSANPDPLQPIRLVEDLDAGAYPHEQAIRLLRVALAAVVENYEEYKDYNTTTSYSDYGDNLYRLLEFLRLKVGYERHVWQLRPLMVVHEVLARAGKTEAALLWEAEFARLTEPLAEQQLQALARLEQEHGMRLRTVADRLHERFVQALRLDRLCAAIKPVMAEAKTPGGGPMFARFREELRQLSATPAGVGLDVPSWLRRLEAEVQRARLEQTAIVTLAEERFRLPSVPVSWDDLHRQLATWEHEL
ncbi:MAG: hypothetical protein NZ700_15870 [Gemmataceae bacterium]|nr:hypothetical protein [Gemmataceae bacterium]MDW8267500.1 hypothetical protein [Gemmataceae bacterium]